jgi:hypothetical protein
MQMSGESDDTTELVKLDLSTSPYSNGADVGARQSTTQ